MTTGNLKIGDELIVPDWRRIFRNLVFREGSKFHERTVRARLQQIHGNTFWDIGANIGFYSFWLRKNFKKIVAVEPNPQTAYMLRKRKTFCLARNIEVRQVALSNCRGWTALYSQREYKGPGIGNLIAGISNLYSTDSLLAKFEYRPSRDFSGKSDIVRKDRSSFQVYAERFDDLRTGPVDLVKIDVEGAEFQVLEGMRDSIKAHLVKCIMVELHNREDKTRLESTFAENGYALEWIDPDHLFAKVS